MHYKIRKYFSEILGNDSTKLFTKFKACAGLTCQFLVSDFLKNTCIKILNSLYMILQLLFKHFKSFAGVIKINRFHLAVSELFDGLVQKLFKIKAICFIPDLKAS